MIWLNLIGYALTIIGGINTIWFGFWWLLFFSGSLGAKINKSEKYKKNIQKVEGYYASARERFFIALIATIIGYVLITFIT